MTYIDCFIYLCISKQAVYLLAKCVTSYYNRGTKFWMNYFTIFVYLLAKCIYIVIYDEKSWRIAYGSPPRLWAIFSTRKQNSNSQDVCLCFGVGLALNSIELWVVSAGAGDIQQVSIYMAGAFGPYLFLLLCYFNGGGQYGVDTTPVVSCPL